MEKKKSNVLNKIQNEWLVDVIITFKGDVNEIRNAGTRLTCVNGNIAVGRAPVSRLEEIAALETVVYMEASHADYSRVDKSVPDIGVVQVREQLGYTGKGVIAGIIDSGIDWTHEAFLNNDGTTRIKYILDLSEPGSWYGGTLYTREQIDAALQGSGTVNEKDFSGHGTHVAGIIAGQDEFDVFDGVATDVELIVVKATRDELSREFQTADQIISLNFIDSVASVLGKPYVTNMSFGGHFGAHDGTTAVERFIDSITGPGLSGKAIITVAGNEGDELIHAQADLGGDEKLVDVTFQVDDYLSLPGSENDLIYFDAWYDGSEKIAVTVIAPSGHSFGTCFQGNVLEKNTDEGSVYVWNGYYDTGNGYQLGINPFNNDREIYIEISDIDGAVPASGEWTLKFTGQNGMVDIWKVDATMPVSFKEGSVDFGNISIPGTARNSITVGAYITKYEWDDKDGNSFYLNDIPGVGDIASFSNRGPTRDDRTKPDITAPGQIIASAYSQEANPFSETSIFYSGDFVYPNAYISYDDRYGLASGTSFSAPHVAGVICLLLQKNFQATAYQIKQVLTENARVDSYVDTTPSDLWGWGKLDAFAALQDELVPEPPLTFELVKTYPNPFSMVTKIEYILPFSEAFQEQEIKIFNSLGQQVRVLLSEKSSVGKNVVYWDGRDYLGYKLSSGIYFVQFTSGSIREIAKVVLVNAGN